jgi:hypothetical protein
MSLIEKSDQRFNSTVNATLQANKRSWRNNGLQEFVNANNSGTKTKRRKESMTETSGNVVVKI